MTSSVIFTIVLSVYLILGLLIGNIFSAYLMTNGFLICDFIESLGCILWRCKLRKEMDIYNDKLSSEKKPINSWMISDGMRICHLLTFISAFILNSYLFFRLTCNPERVICLILIVQSIHLCHYLIMNLDFDHFTVTQQMLFYSTIVWLIPCFWWMLSFVYPLLEILNIYTVIRIILLGLSGRLVSLIVKRHLGITRYSGLLGSCGWLDIFDSTYLAAILV
jgi:hypothetical protein